VFAQLTTGAYSEHVPSPYLDDEYLGFYRNYFATCSKL